MHLEKTLDLLARLNGHIHAGQQVVIIVFSRKRRLEQQQLTGDLRISTPVHIRSIRKYDLGVLRQRSECLSRECPGFFIHMDIEIGIGAVEKQNLFFPRSRNCYAP